MPPVRWADGSICSILTIVKGCRQKAFAALFAMHEWQMRLFFYFYGFFCEKFKHFSYFCINWEKVVLNAEVV